MGTPPQTLDEAVRLVEGILPHGAAVRDGESELPRWTWRSADRRDWTVALGFPWVGAPVPFVRLTAGAQIRGGRFVPPVQVGVDLTERGLWQLQQIMSALGADEAPPAWAVRHPGMGVIGYTNEAEARTAAGTAGTLLRRDGDQWAEVES